MIIRRRRDKDFISGRGIVAIDYDTDMQTEFFTMQSKHKFIKLLQVAQVPPKPIT